MKGWASTGKHVWKETRGWLPKGLEDLGARGIHLLLKHHRGMSQRGQGCCQRTIAPIHESPMQQISTLEVADRGRVAWGVCVCLSVMGERDITGFLISLLAFFAHYPTQFHQLSTSHFFSKGMGSTPSFFIVWTMVQANLGEGKHLWIRINLEQASHRHSPLILQTKPLGCTDHTV